MPRRRCICRWESPSRDRGYDSPDYRYWNDYRNRERYRNRDDYRDRDSFRDRDDFRRRDRFDSPSRFRDPLFFFGDSPFFFRDFFRDRRFRESPFRRRRRIF